MLKSNKKPVAKKAVAKKPTAKTTAKKTVAKKAKRTPVKYPKFKEVQETFVIRQGDYFTAEMKAKKQKRIKGIFVECPVEAKEQIVEVIKLGKFAEPKMIRLGHSRLHVFLPTLDLKSKRTEKVKNAEGQTVTKVRYDKHAQNSLAAITTAVRQAFPYSSLTQVRKNGLIIDKRRVEEEGRRAVAVKKAPKAGTTKKAAPKKASKAKAPAKKAVITKASKPAKKG